MDKLQHYEVNNLLEYIEYCNKNDWERTRMLMYITAQVNSTKKLKAKDILKFPWDIEEHDYSITDNDIKQLREKAKLISDKYMK